MRDTTVMKELNVCIGSSCHLKGSYSVIRIFQKLIEEHGFHEKIEMKAQFYMKECQKGVSVSMGEEIYSVSPETAKGFFIESIMPELHD